MQGEDGLLELGRVGESAHRCEVQGGDGND